MNIISCEEACCIFYCEKFNEENAKIYTERIAKMEDVEICYKNNPNELMLICESRMCGAPDLFTLYKLREELGEKVKKMKTTKMILHLVNVENKSVNEIVAKENYNIDNETIWQK